MAVRPNYYGCPYYGSTYYGCTYYGSTYYGSTYQEHALSLLRSALVNNSTICDVAATCGMHHCMRYYHEQMDGPGRARRGMLADCFEAFVGALFLDKQPLGMAHAKAFTHTALFTLTSQTIEERRWMDPKARLQYCLAEFNSQEGLNSQKGALHKTFSLLDEWGSPSSALNLGPNNHYPDLALTLP